MFKIGSFFRSLLSRKKKRGYQDKRYKRIHTFVEGLLGVPPEDVELYVQAFTHRSSPESGRGFNNERLEFLGDSVLSCIVGALLYEMYEEEKEGVLTSYRSFLVSRSHMNELALRLRLDTMLRISSGVNLKQSDALGNCLEAFVGAMYLDQGYDFTHRFVSQYIVVGKKNLKRVAAREEDYKTEFIIMMQQKKITYEFAHIDTRTEPKIGTVHRCEILLSSQKISVATGTGQSKKMAHQNAAKDALKIFRKNPSLLEQYKE